MRAATYQAVFLGRVPPFAIVQETVNLVKAKRGELLGKLVNAAKGTENLMPLLIECVENDITLGEICNTLRGVWGDQ